MTKKPAAVLTAQQLIDVPACQPQIKLFCEKFGESVVVTVAKARGAAGEFDWSWARRLLDAPARAEYDRARDAARAEYERATATAWAHGYIATCQRRDER